MHYQDKLRVGAAQINTTLGELNANIDRHLSLIAEAKRKGVELLVFPELSLTSDAGGDALGRPTP